MKRRAKKLERVAGAVRELQWHCPQTLAQWTDQVFATLDEIRRQSHRRAS